MYAYEISDMSFYETAPRRYVSEEVLEITPEKLFDIFEDPEAWPQWVSAIDQVEWTSDKPYGPGTTRTVTMSKWAGNMVAYEKFITWEQNRRMSFFMTHSSTNTLKAFGEDYLVIDLQNGKCLLKLTVAFHPRGNMMSSVNYFIQPMMGWYCGSLLKKLKKYIRDNKN